MPASIGQLELHQHNGFASCRVDRELFKPPLQLLRANNRVQQFAAWCDRLAGVGVRKKNSLILAKKDSKQFRELITTLRSTFGRFFLAKFIGATALSAS